MRKAAGNTSYSELRALRCGDAAHSRLPHSAGARSGTVREAASAAIPSSSVRLPGMRETLSREKHFCRAIHALYPPNWRENHDPAAPAQQHEGYRKGRRRFDSVQAENAFSASSLTRSTAVFSIFCRHEPWKRFRIICVRFPIATR